MFQRTLLQNKQAAGARAADAAPITSDKGPTAKLLPARHRYGEDLSFAACDGATCVSLDRCGHLQVFLAAGTQLHSPLLFPLCLLACSSNGIVQRSTDTNTQQSPDMGFNACNTALVKPDKAILLSLLGSTANKDRQGSWKAGGKQPKEHAASRQPAPSRSPCL